MYTYIHTFISGSNRHVVLCPGNLLGNIQIVTLKRNVLILQTEGEILYQVLCMCGDLLTYIIEILCETLCYISALLIVYFNK